MTPEQLRNLRLWATVYPLLGVGLLAGTIYLLRDGFTWWAILTGFLATAHLCLALLFVIYPDLFEMVLKELASPPKSSVSREESAPFEEDLEEAAFPPRSSMSWEESALEWCPHCGERVRLYFESGHEQMCCPKCTMPVR